MIVMAMATYLVDVMMMLFLLLTPLTSRFSPRLYAVQDLDQLVDVQQVSGLMAAPE